MGKLGTLRLPTHEWKPPRVGTGWQRIVELQTSVSYFQCQWQNVIAGERCQVQLTRIVGRCPNDFLQFGSRYKLGMVGSNVEQMRFKQVVRLIRRCARKRPEKPGFLLGRCEMQLLCKFTCKGFERRFAGVDFAAGLHERGGAALPDQKHASVIVVYQGRRDANQTRHEPKMDRCPKVRNV